MPEINKPTTSTTPAGSPDPNTPTTPETLYSLPEQLPLPENGLDHFDILHCILSRAAGIMNLVAKDTDMPADISDASWAAMGLVLQAKRVVSNLHTTQEVQS